jgi:hypothetical protein
MVNKPLIIEVSCELCGNQTNFFIGETISLCDPCFNKACSLYQQFKKEVLQQEKTLKIGARQ